MDAKIVIALYNSNTDTKFRLYGHIVKYWQLIQDRLKGHKDDFYKYTHIEIIADRVWHTAASDENGIAVRSLEHGFINGRWDFIEIYTTSIQKDQIKEFFVENDDDKYDWLAIFLARFLPLNMQSKSRWFCSEATVASMCLAKVFKFKKKPYKYSVSDVPRELLKHGLFIQEKEYLWP